MAISDNAPNDANKGLNVKKFSIAVFAAAAILLAILFLVVAWKGKKLVPQTPNPHDTTSRLTLPASADVLAASTLPPDPAV